MFQFLNREQLDKESGSNSNTRNEIDKGKAERNSDIHCYFPHRPSIEQ